MDEAVNVCKPGVAAARAALLDRRRARVEAYGAGFFGCHCRVGAMTETRGGISLQCSLHTWFGPAHLRLARAGTGLEQVAHSSNPEHNEGGVMGSSIGPATMISWRRRAPITASGQVRSGQVRFITRPNLKSRTMRAKRKERSRANRTKVPK